MREKIPPFSLLVQKNFLPLPPQSDNPTAGVFEVVFKPTIMVATKDCIEKLKRYYTDNAKHYGIRNMAIFGSVARNEQTEESDIDIIYEGEANLFLRCKIKDELETLFGVPVDLIRMRESLQGTPFHQRIKNDLIYV